MKKYLSLLIFISIVSSFINNVFAANVDLVVSPIKYEITGAPGESITKTATLINKTNDTLLIHTGKSDFISNDTSGNPVFVRKSEIVYNDQELANWININLNDFYIAGKEEKDIEFTINIPTDATPGGHYGAIFFKNNGKENSSGGGQIKLNIDYGVLLLVTVDGEIIDNGTPGEPIINNGNATTGPASGGIQRDSCPFGDLTNSNIDGKCIDDFGLGNIINDIKGENSNTGTGSNTSGTGSNDKEDFVIDFGIPFNNDGNTHIKPTGKITLVDENGNPIKGVGKEIILNDEGAVIGEKIVDYLPINDNGGNILPNTQRIFESEWKGFPYEAYDENGKKIIKYWSPSDYYSRKNIEDKKFIFPWQRINENVEQKQIKALIELAYKNYKGEEIKFNSAKEFSVDYIVKSVGINPYFVIGFIFSLGIFWFFFIIWRRKTKKKCHNCKKRIDKDMKICPYCGEKQKDKKK
ncbi:MAG: hypothetical protein PHH98_03525 [Candidatus Gracilibacteria bacterium]|nr:hypothetical protein [Candidatus Gracilibacteria bacterium]